MTEYGRVTVRLTPGGEAGWCYFSDPVSFKTKAGDSLQIGTSIVQPDGSRYFGSTGPFEEEELTEEQVSAEVGVQVAPDGRSFRIGLRLLRDTEAQAVEVAYVIRQKNGAQKKDNEPEAVISPTPPETATDFYIDAVPGYILKNHKFMFTCHRPAGVTDSVVWTVEGEDSGTINGYGMYTAPDRTGVFQVCAAIGDRYRTSAYIVVRE